MPLHLVKMCVGIDDVDELVAYRAEKRRAEKRCFHRTRHTPKRAEEILDGGSLYWVIKQQIRARQRILGFHPDVDAEGRPRCAIELDWEIVATEAQPFRAFQGWRYLEAKAAPPDRFWAVGDDELPPKMARELRELGLL